MRVNITQEGSEQVLWYKVSKSGLGANYNLNISKEGFLSDDEIVEHIVVRRPYTSTRACLTVICSITRPLLSAGQYIVQSGDGTFAFARPHFLQVYTFNCFPCPRFRLIMQTGRFHLPAVQIFPVLRALVLVRA